MQIAGIPQYRLGEGVDASGVTTKILSCNFSINIIIDNNSKLFALHIQPPIIKLIFGRLNFATSQVNYTIQALLIYEHLEYQVHAHI